MKKVEKMAQTTKTEMGMMNKKTRMQIISIFYLSKDPRSFTKDGTKTKK
jgi:hypothetical protein